MSKNSALSGPRGVSVGDELTAVDDCKVHGLSDWTECISEVARTQQRGFCLPVTLLHQLDIALHQHGKCLCLSICLSVSLPHLTSCKCSFMHQSYVCSFVYFVYLCQHTLLVTNNTVFTFNMSKKQNTSRKQFLGSLVVRASDL